MTHTVDVAGVIVTVPDPDVIDGLSARFQAMGDALAQASEQLAPIAAPQPVNPWTGPASEAFAQSVGSLPGHLDAARDSYHLAGTALSQYADQVRPVAAALTSLAGQAVDATGDLNATQAAHDQAFNQDPFSPDLIGLDARLNNAHAAVTGLQAQARAQHSELLHLAATCVSRIRHASPAGGKPGLLSQIGHVAEKVVVQPFVDSVADGDKLLHHPSLANLCQELKDLTDAIGMLGLLVPPLDEILVPALIGTAAAGVGMDLLALGLGDVSGKKAGEDILDESMAGADGALGRAIKAAKSANEASDAAADAGKTADKAPTAGSVDKDGTPPTTPGGPKPSSLKQLEKAHKAVVGAELTDSATAPDDNGDKSSVAPAAPGGPTP